MDTQRRDRTSKSKKLKCMVPKPLISITLGESPVYRLWPPISHVYPLPNVPPPLFSLSGGGNVGRGDRKGGQVDMRR